MRLAEKYDAAQDRGEVAKAGNPNCSSREQLLGPSDLGLSRKGIHEARQMRDAERANRKITETQIGLVHDRPNAMNRPPTRP